MYYYMLKITSIYQTSLDMVVLNLINTTTANAGLQYVSVNAYDSYNGSGIFNGSGTSWWARTYMFPAYLIFSSNVLVSNLNINCGYGQIANGAIIKDFSLYVSKTLLSYTDVNWKLKLSGTMGNIFGYQTIKISNNLYLIKQYSTYYSIKPAYYDASNKIYIPLALSGGLVPNKADIDLYGFDNLANITSSVTVGTETFKPIDKLLSSFQLKEYKAK